MMNPSTSVASQENADRGGYWRAFGSGSPLYGDVSSLSTLGKLTSGSGEISSSGDELALKVRKPYTITKQRERWTEDEHTKFLEALKLYGRAWRRIEEHIGTKTAVQIRSHAQKFFSKLEREATAAGGTVTGVSQEIDIPPPRPKRKPSHPYPRKAGGSFSGSPLMADEDNSPPATSSPVAAAPSKSGISGDGFVKSAGFSPCSRSKPPPLDIPSPAAQPSESPASLKLFGQTVVVPTSHTARAARSSDAHTGTGLSDGACETSEDRTLSGKVGRSLVHTAEIRGGDKCGTRRLVPGSNVELSTAGTSDTVLESGISILEGGGVSNASDQKREAEQSSQGRSSQSKRRDVCYKQHEDSTATFARGGAIPGREDAYDFSQYRGTATVAHHLAAALSAGMHLHSMSAMPEKPPFTLMDFAAMHPARYIAGYPGLPGLPGAPQHAAFSLESIARMTSWHSGVERPAFPSGIWPGLIPGVTATGLPLPMAMPLPGGMLRPPLEGASGQDDGAAAAVAAATIAAASAWWALQGSVPPGVHPGMAAMYNPSAAAAAAAVASVAEAGVVQNGCFPSRSFDRGGQDTDPEDEQQVGSNDSEDGVAEESLARKSSAAKRAERASRMKEQKARRGSLSAHALCTDSSPSGWGNCRSSRAGSFCGSSAFPGRMKLKSDKVGLHQKDIDKRSSPSYSGEGSRKRARLRSMTGSNTPPGEERLSDDGDKSGDERGQPTSSDGSGSEAGDPPVGRGGGGRSSNSSGCGNVQGKGGKAGSLRGGSSDGEEVRRSRSPEEGRDNAVHSEHQGNVPENRIHSETGGSSTHLVRSTSSEAEQLNGIECDRVPSEEQLASDGPSAEATSCQRASQWMKAGEATPSSGPHVDCQSSRCKRNGSTAPVCDSSAPPCRGSNSQDDLGNGLSLNGLRKTASAPREREEEEASSSLEKRNDQHTTLESTTQHSRENSPSPVREDAGASQDDAGPKFGCSRGIDSDAEAHLQRLSMLRTSPTSASSSGSARFSGAGFVPYQRSSTEASGTDSPGSKAERLHLRTEDACNFEGQSWKQKRPCTREEPVPA